jgi:hypothetical protein
MELRLDNTTGGGCTGTWLDMTVRSEGDPVSQTFPAGAGTLMRQLDSAISPPLFLAPLNGGARRSSQCRHCPTGDRDKQMQTAVRSDFQGFLRWGRE